MLAIAVGAAATLIGVALGGATRALEASYARKKDAEALLSALVAEVEAITRLINHRQFIPALLEIQAKATKQVEEGEGSDPASFIIISLLNDYFTTYNASVSKVGLLIHIGLIELPGSTRSQRQ